MNEQLIGKIAGIIISLLIIWYIRSKRELTPEKVKLNESLILQHKDSNVLILYLRDFVVDGVKSAEIKVGYFTSSFTDTNFETELSLSVSRVGRFIAVGIKSYSGDVGAQRYVVEDEDWKDRVTDLMEKTSLILIRPSLSVGLIWELEQLVKNKYLQKTVICFNKRQDGSHNYKLFREVIKPFLKLPLSVFASKYMWFNERLKLRKSSRLEDIPLYQDLLVMETQRLAQIEISKKSNLDQPDNIVNGSPWLTILLAALFIIILTIVIYLKWG